MHGSSTTAWLLAALIGLSVAGCNRAPPKPPLPEALKKIQCRPNPALMDKKKPAIVSEGYEVIRFENKVVAAPCSRPGRFRETLINWTKEKDPSYKSFEPVVFQPIIFDKMIDGEFRITSHNAASPTKVDPVKYGFTATPAHRDPGSRKDVASLQFEVMVPTPPQFAEVGPETPFVCTGEPRFPKLCFGRARTGTVFWHFSLWLQPRWRAEWDIVAEITEAYALAGAHIIQ